MVGSDGVVGPDAAKLGFIFNDVPSHSGRNSYPLLNTG